MPLNEKERRPLRFLAAIDFSACSRKALRTAVETFQDRQLEIFLLHVIDERFIDQCAKHCLDLKEDLKKSFFMEAKEKLCLLAQEEGLADLPIQKIVCQGVPFQQINRQAEKCQVDFIVLGSCGMAGNTESIFFGGTTERVVRFISRPVFCIPPHERKQ